MRNLLKRTTNRIQKVNVYMRLFFGEASVRHFSVIRYSIGIIICHFLYGTSIGDYFELRFFEKTHKERRAYFTSKHARKFLRNVNGEKNNRQYKNKIFMYRAFERFIKREQLICPPKDFDEFDGFLQRHGTVVYKRSNTCCGVGIELWSAEDSDIRKLYKRSLQVPAILDERVIQHPEIAHLNPDSVNTVRTYTLMAGDTCHFVAAEFRMGRSGRLVDNLERGGLTAHVDLKTGAIVGDAYDLRRNPYSVHPDTGVAIRNFVLPLWSEVLRFTEECARSCPLAYVEWDIAIREKDCVLIEANTNARNSEIQMGTSHGMKKEFEELEKLYHQTTAGKNPL